MPAWSRCLRERAVQLEHLPELERRRTNVIESVSRRSGTSVAILEDAYDIALEEGVDPVLALEIIGCGVGVLELDAPEPDSATISLAPPEWVSPAVEPRPEQVREKHMRLTYRRMRGLLEGSGVLEDAIDEFLNAPDVGHFPYDPDLS